MIRKMKKDSVGEGVRFERIRRITGKPGQVSL